MKFITKSLQTFIQEASLKHNNKYDYSKVIYVGNKVKVEIICPIHGSFLQRTDVHLGGKGCKQCGINKVSTERNNLAKSRFLDKCRLLHPTLNFDKSIYINNHTKVIVNCSIHGDFKIEPANILRKYGCRKCGNKRINTNKKLDIFKIIEKSKLTHSNKYNYSKIDYKKVVSQDNFIACPIHGEFIQNLLNHSNGQGCPKCNKQYGAWGFKYSRWKNVQKGRKAKVYFIRLYNDKESFYKVGITYQSLKNRLRNFPYMYEIINTREFSDPQKALDLELKFKRFYKKYKYKPLIKFGGMCECFKTIN